MEFNDCSTDTAAHTHTHDAHDLSLKIEWGKGKGKTTNDRKNPSKQHYAEMNDIY